MKMSIRVFVVLLLVVTQSAVMEAGKREIIIGKAVQCVLDTLPLDMLKGDNLFTNKFMMNISSQWDPLNPHDYLMWPVYDGPEAWAASCHFSSTIKQCLEPIIKSGITLLTALPEQYSSILTSALYFMTLCEQQQSILTNPTTNNAECVHQRMLSDDVLRCHGILGWLNGNPFIISNINYPDLDYKWITNALSSVYECIYKRGNWRHSCGSEVEAMMGNLTKSFSNLAKLTVRMKSTFSIVDTHICDICKPGSDLTNYDRLNKLRSTILANLWFRNQSPYLFRQCKEVNYPLNQCHLRLIWRRDVYAMFCHQVKSVIIPVFTPHLPLCDFGDWMRSASRICDMGYQMFMDTASHIARCTKDQDELFPCYKGLYIGSLSWGLVSAGRMWLYGYKNGFSYRTVYNRVKSCVPHVYDHLRQSPTCRPGPLLVVQLIQDLRVVLMIDVPAISSYGPLWHFARLTANRFGTKVNHC